jgi:hypothetical protein
MSEGEYCDQLQETHGAATLYFDGRRLPMIYRLLRIDSVDMQIYTVNRLVTVSGILAIGFGGIPLRVTER